MRCRTAPRSPAAAGQAPAGQGGKSRFALQTLAAEDFPRLARPAGDAAKFKLEQKALRRLLSLVQYAMAQQDIRYYLNGLLMVVEEGSLKLVATDGHRWRTPRSSSAVSCRARK